MTFNIHCVLCLVQRQLWMTKKMQINAGEKPQIGMKILHYDDAVDVSWKKQKREPDGLVAPKHLFGYKTTAKLQIIAMCAWQQ